ncbi:hypothetical protein Brsp07_04670 [Brucella sp. NBRC 14130]|uniref:hypothetical protein n=1 Tax=Brucella sp. NBRC 14130 TaxID=3075483 RepID=UPI0030A0386B
MSALKKVETYSLTHVQVPFREIAPADYFDEISDEYFELIKKTASSLLDDEEWEVVDGPAW